MTKRRYAARHVGSEEPPFLTASGGNPWLPRKDSDGKNAGGHEGSSHGVVATRADTHRRRARCRCLECRSSTQSRAI
jgi:hypothetical protein